jgi:ATP-dependent RNA helicase DDX55/SPB4
MSSKIAPTFVRVLIATHIGSRSLDYPGVSCIIQYDFPDDEISFYQQVGRAARIGKPEPAEGFTYLE